MKNKSFVLDVNIWMSYFYNGDANHFYELIEKHKIVIYRSNNLTDELEKVLHYKKFAKRIILPKEFYMSLYFNSTYNVITLPIFTSCRDTKDNYLFDLAYQSNADYLVSGDIDVLNTPIVPPLQLISFKQFKSLIEVICN